MATKSTENILKTLEKLKEERLSYLQKCDLLTILSGLTEILKNLLDGQKGPDHARYNKIIIEAISDMISEAKDGKR